MREYTIPGVKRMSRIRANNYSALWAVAPGAMFGLKIGDEVLVNGNAGVVENVRADYLLVRIGGFYHAWTSEDMARLYAPRIEKV